MGEIDGVLNDVDLVLHGRRDVHGSVGDDQRFRVRGHIHHEAVAHSPRGAQARFALDDGAHQLVGVQAAFHQRFGLALSYELDRLRGGFLAVLRLDDRQPRDIDVVLLRHGLDACLGPDQNRRDQAEPGRVYCTAQRAFVAWMCYRYCGRWQRFAEVEQPLVLFMTSFHQPIPSLLWISLWILLWSAWLRAGARLRLPPIPIRARR